jgi:ABC-type multidrug transport system fused ATPase/permease subunit
MIDGMDIRSFDLTEYRQQLGVVSQIPFLFSGSVMDNICYACPRSLGEGGSKIWRTRSEMVSGWKPCRTD